MHLAVALLALLSPIDRALALKPVSPFTRVRDDSRGDHVND